MIPERVSRDGLFWRVCDPTWADPLNTSFAARHGGRWNPPGSFGILYLNATLVVARANARRWLADHAIAVADLRPGRGPQVLECTLAPVPLVDAVTDPGLTALGLTTDYPWGVPHATCQPIGATLYPAGEAGLVCRAAPECPGPGQSLGEEAALFDRGAPLVTPGARRPFEEWYPR